MTVPVDDSSPFGKHRAGNGRERIHAAMALGHGAGFLGRRVFGRLRWLERSFRGRTPAMFDVERLGLRWRLYTEGNVSDSRLLLRPHSFEPLEFQAIRDRVRPGFTFIDVGANCGFYSLRIAHALGGDGTVIAIEPHPETRRRLAFNVELNPPARVRILDCAIGDHPGRATLLEDGHNLGRTRISGQGSIEVEVRTLLDVADQEGLRRIDAIKVDVEGFEDRVLGPFFRDAPDSLLPGVIVAEVRHRKDWKTDWLAAAERRGYRVRTRTRSRNVILDHSRRTA